MHNSVYENMSSAEHEVCGHLKELGLWWHYEQPVFVYDNMQRPRVWTPDFYIPELGIYIEVVGNRYNGNYTFREKVYQLNRIPIIFLDIQHEDWRGKLSDEMHAIQHNRYEKIKLSFRKRQTDNT